MAVKVGTPAVTMSQPCKPQSSIKPTKQKHKAENTKATSEMVDYRRFI